MTLLGACSFGGGERRVECHFEPALSVRGQVGGQAEAHAGGGGQLKWQRAALWRRRPRRRSRDLGRGLCSGSAFPLPVVLPKQFLSFLYLKGLTGCVLLLFDR